jgi:hypothetical protein
LRLPSGSTARKPRGPRRACLRHRHRTADRGRRDGSLSLTPELLYTEITNVEIRLRGGINIGGRLTEFGEKQVDERVELRIRFFF